MPSILALLLLLTQLLTACAPYPLHANMSDAEIRQTIATNIPAGTPSAEVKSRLIALRVSDHDLMNYPPTDSRPHVLLARIFEPGGFHLDMDDDLVDWVDVSFVFTPQDNLDRVLLFRDAVRYFHREPVSHPRRPAAGPVRRYPILPPPPLDPLHAAK